MKDFFKRILTIIVVMLIVASIIAILSNNTFTKVILNDTTDESVPMAQGSVVITNQHDDNIGFKADILEVDRANTNHKEFVIEVARTFAQKSQGLMFREKLDKKSGMLFLFDIPQHTSFWMKDTLIPLDIIFISESNKIIKIAKNTQPLSETAIDSEGTVIAVLEINAGLSDELNISVGNHVYYKIHKIFTP